MNFDCKLHVERSYIRFNFFFSDLITEDASYLRRMKMKNALSEEIESEKETDDTRIEEECLEQRKKNNQSGSQEGQQGSVPVEASVKFLR